FGKLLEEIHVTWTQFGKKRDKIAVSGDGVSISIDVENPNVEMAFGGNTRELGSFREKRTRLQLYTKVEEEKGTQTLETASQLLMTASDYQRDDIRKFEIALGLNRHSEALEDSAKQWH
ncbi:hypothetical protein Tco_1222569, partial [Tanacetum coccineum]